MKLLLFLKKHELAASISLILVSFTLLIYPIVSNYIFEHRVDSLISTYARDTAAIDTAELDSMREQATEYNAALANGRIKLTDPFRQEKKDSLSGEYPKLLSTSETGIMSYLQIPRIDVFLPVYHGTSAAVLENGVGHLEGSSLPIGGESTHCVLSAHTGLNHAKLFTDLTELENGDLFFLQTLGETLAYEVDQILVVEPYDCSALGVEPGKDYCTLVTCTPYGVNSHRLLVRGKRVPYEEAEISRVETEKEAPVTSQWMREYAHALMAGVILVTVAVLAFLVYGKWGKRQ